MTTRSVYEMEQHPDLAEMRARYDRAAEKPAAQVVSGLTFLSGLYLAISPWVVHFRGTYPNIAMNDLILGIGLATIGLGLMLFPGRALGLGWMLIPIGIWMIISPWVTSVGHSAPKGIIWSNLVAGIITCLLGVATTAMAVMGRRRVEVSARR
jgi:hypothetical protein